MTYSEHIGELHASVDTWRYGVRYLRALAKVLGYTIGLEIVDNGKKPNSVKHTVNTGTMHRFASAKLAGEYMERSLQGKYALGLM